mgnify:FL=1
MHVGVHIAVNKADKAAVPLDADVLAADADATGDEDDERRKMDTECSRTESRRVLEVEERVSRKEEGQVRMRVDDDVALVDAVVRADENEKDECAAKDDDAKRKREGELLLKDRKVGRHSDHRALVIVGKLTMVTRRKKMG